MSPVRSGSVFLLLATTVLHAQSTVPAAGTPIPAQSLTAGGAPSTVDLRNHFTLPGVTGQIAQFDTAFGLVNVELRADAAPRHVANFLEYVQAGAYTNTVFHRAAAFESGGNSIVQGGGVRSNLTSVPTFAPIALEYNLPNARGTLAAARTSDINSATSQWYFNVRDNSTILGPANGGGYSVFGRVIGNGMTVIDRVAALPLSGDGYPLRDFTGGTPTVANLVVVNSIASVTVFPTGSGAAVLRFAASSSSSSVVIAAVSGSTLTLSPGAPGTANVTVTATDTNGSTASQTVVVTVTGTSGTNAPVITAQPQPVVRLASGTVNTVALSISATGSPSPIYQWRRNGVPIIGQQSPSYVLTNATEAQAGSYTCVVVNTEGTVESQPSVLSFAATSPVDVSRLVNLAIRTNAGTGAQTLIVGFSLGGAGTAGATPLLVRGVGPSLGQFGLTGVLADPIATMFRGDATVATNDNWGGVTAISDRASQVGAFALAPVSSLDAALALAPAGGSYTVQITGRNEGTGIALAEIYEAVTRSAFTPATPRLVNVSARTEVGSGSDILIAGFVVGGTTAKTVLIRAIGPTLAVFGVTDTISDPKLQLFSGATMVSENDNWGGDPQLTAIAGSVGAFALANAASKDAVLLVTLPPGSYTAQVSGANGGTGVALVELYEVP